MAQDFAKKFYCTKAWKDLRRDLIISTKGICQQCGRVIVDSSKLVGHHRIRLNKDNINNPVITLNPANIEIICVDCHNKKHKRFRYSRKEVYIVWGSPLSGKNTLVNQLFERGDIILDIDRLYQAVSNLELYDKPNSLRFNVFALRDKMLDMIKTRYGKWNTAYVIGGYPCGSERARLAQELGAELIYSESTKAECYERAQSKGVYCREWIEYIDKWWAEYTPPTC